MHKNVFELHQTVCQPAGGYMANGIHDLTFSFTLPAKSPSSMLYSQQGTYNAPLVAITYSIKAQLHFAALRGPPGLDPLFANETFCFGKEKMFIVREAVDFNNMAVQSEKTGVVKSCCGCED